MAATVRSKASCSFLEIMPRPEVTREKREAPAAAAWAAAVTNSSKGGKG